MSRRCLAFAVMGLLLCGAEPKGRARVGEIIIVGNTYTIESVIRRQLPFKPGDVLDYTQLKTAERNLAKLGVFAVDAGRGIAPTVTVLDDAGRVKNILVRVREKEANDPPVSLDSASARDADRKEKQKLQGAWKAVSVKSSDGEKKLEASISGTVVRIGPDGSFTPAIATEEFGAGTLILDPTKAQKAFDLTHCECGFYLGIYEFKDETLRLCMNTCPDRNRRPVDFRLKDGEGLLLITLKRDKP